MALPASGPISMSMVATEFSSSQSTNMSLRGFGAALNTPVTTNVFLAASFYGQSAGVSVTSWIFKSDSGNTWDDVETACAALAEGGASNTTLYHDGSGTFPADGDKIYTDNPGTTTAGAGVYAYVNGRANFTFSANSSGVVSGTAACEG